MKKTTIVDVMAGEGISVPAVQRDYVMGRPEAHEKLKKSLELFLEAIFDGKIDPLYFVYGIKKGEAGPLMLLDGQQRLTTLVLVVWFCDESLSVVGNWKFTYEMRRAARYFMENLVKTPCTNHEKPWENIKSSDWFLPDMDLDATVSGIHKALDLLGKLYRTRYASRNVLPIANLELALKRIPFSLEEMKDLGVDEHSYDQIFLKMNARGLPLSPWEKMKSVLDQHGDQEWKDNIDGDWSEKLWKEISWENVDRFDNAMLKIVKLAALYVDLQESGNNFSSEMSPILLDKWLNEDEVRKTRFWRICKDYFRHAVKPEFGRCWQSERAENYLWNKEYKYNHGFADFLTGDSFDQLLILRFALMCSKVYDEAERRSKRIFLNLIDRLIDSHASISTSEVKNLGKVFKSFLASSNLRKLAEYVEGRPQKGSTVILLRQLHQELLKMQFPEKKIMELEKDDLVYQSRIDFLLWGMPPKSFEELESRLNLIKSRIEEDWVSMYCDILMGLNQDNEDGGSRLALSSGDSIRIPYSNLRDWRNEILKRDDVISVLVENCVGVRHVKTPAWLAHFSQLAAREALDEKHQALRVRDRWTCVIRNTNITPYSIRLDYNENECCNRKLLKGEVIYYGESEDRWAVREAKEPGMGYNVWHESWWTTTAPQSLKLDKVVED